MHIVVEGIFLKRLDFEVFRENLETPSYSMKMTSHTNFPNDNVLVQITDFDVAHAVENPSFKFRFSFEAHFRSEGEGEPTLKEFAAVNAPAYIVPYARELIANITSRTGVLPTLIIPPINVLELIKEGLHHSDDPTLGLDNDMHSIDDVPSQE
jgi:preprotein translocase subunit SecB